MVWLFPEMVWIDMAQFISGEIRQKKDGSTLWLPLLKYVFLLPPIKINFPADVWEFC